MFWVFCGLLFGIYFNRLCDLKKKKRFLCGYLIEEIEMLLFLVGEICYMLIVSIDINFILFIL